MAFGTSMYIYVCTMDIILQSCDEYGISDHFDNQIRLGQSTLIIVRELLLSVSRLGLG
jgi:hypothetical protein